MSYGLCVINSDCPDPQQRETGTGQYQTELISKQSVKMPTKSTSVITKRNKQKPISKRKAQWTGQLETAKHGTSRKGDLSNISRKDVQLLSHCCPLSAISGAISLPPRAGCWTLPRCVYSNHCKPASLCQGLGVAHKILCQDLVAKVIFWKRRARGTSLLSARSVSK